MTYRKWFQQYLKSVGDTEAPITFHRWSALSGLAALLGRRRYLPFGSSCIYPNLFITVVASSGARKSTAIKYAKKLFMANGVEHVAPDSVTKQKLLLIMGANNYLVSESPSGVREETTEAKPSNMWLAADELMDLFEMGDLNYFKTLGTLYDVPDKYETGIKNGQSAFIHMPCLNMLGGITPTGFIATFPPDIIGQGFFSRMLLVYGERTGRKYAWPKPGDTKARKYIEERLTAICKIPRERVAISPEAKRLGQELYEVDSIINDPRFHSYLTRRYTHLLKIAILLSAFQEFVIDDKCLLHANTILYAAETQMPTALGDFGKGKFAEAGSAVLEAIQRANKPLAINEIWKLVASELNSQKDLAEILKSLKGLGKLNIVTIGQEIKFTACRENLTNMPERFLLPDILTQEEIANAGL